MLNSTRALNTFSFRCALFVLMGCLISHTAFADELTGLQPGWVEQDRLEVTTNGVFSSWLDPITVSLAAETQGDPFIAWGNDFGVAHSLTRVTIQHNYPDILPRDAEVETATMVGEHLPTVTSVETEATIGEIGRWLTAYFVAEGPNAGRADITNRLRIGVPVVYLEWRLGEGMPVSTFSDSFAGSSYNLNNISTSPDILNLSFQVRATTYDPLNANAPLPAPGVQFRARYKTAFASGQEATFYLSDWYETDEHGEALVNVGGGGAVVETVRDLYVQPSFIGLEVDGGTAGFGINRQRIEDLYSFKGKLKIHVTDPLGRPVTGALLQLLGIGSDFVWSDSAGNAEFEIHGGGTDSRDIDITLAPRMTINSSLTQIVDDVHESQLHSESPAFYAVKFGISNTALNYLVGGDSFGDFTLRIYENDTLAAELTGLTAKCAETLTPADHASSVNTFFYPVLPDADARLYRAQIVWENDLGNEVGLSFLGGSRSISEKRIPARDRPFRIHFVGIDTAGAYKAHGRGVMATWASPGRMAKMNDYFQMLFPGPVEFTYGPDLKTSDPWFTFGPYRVLSYFVDLARLRETMPDRPDLIVGVSAAGVIGADGLSEPRFREVVLLDGTGMRESYLLHEYLHALGRVDNYDYETGTGSYGASANGYDPRTMTRVYNHPSVSKPPFQTVMYDRAPRPWLTSDDYSLLLDEATMAIIGKESSAAGVEPVKAEPQEVMYIGGTFMGKQSWSSYNYTLRNVWPIFVDTDEAWQPQEEVSPSARALGVRLSNGQTASVRENTIWIGMWDQEGDGELAAAPLFKIPYDPTVNSVVFESYHHGDVVRTIREVSFSPHAPTVRIDSPAAGTRLAASFPLVFTAEDADAGEQLHAWIKLSDDGGATWRPIGNWFPIDPGQNTFAIPCDDLPAMDSVQVRALVSDGTRSARAEAGPYALDGFATTPRIVAEPAGHELTVRVGSRCALPVRIVNTGRATLEVNFNENAAPSWLACRQLGLQSIAGGGSFEFLFESVAGAVGDLDAQLQFATNDPRTPLLSIPLRLHVVDEATAPVAAAVATDPPAGSGERIAWEQPVRFTVREACGRSGLAGRIDLFHAETGEILATVELAAGIAPGLYEAEWPAPAECFGVPLGVEATLTDSDGGLSSHGGSNPVGWDAVLHLMRRNTAPRFVNPVGDKTVGLVFPQTLEIPFEVVDDEGDPISLAVDHGPELDVRLDAEAGVLHVAHLLDVPYYLPQIRLAATDQWGATSGVTFTVGIGWQNTNYGYLAYLPNFRLESDPMPLVVAGGGTWERPNRVVIEHRTEGSAVWTSLGEYTFTRWDDLKNCWLADCAWDWPNDGADVFELRVTLVGSDGTADPEPPVYRFERPRQGGRVARVEAPAIVSAGAEMTLRIYVENDSSDRWSAETGYGLRALDGVDPLTGLAAAEFMALQQIERGSAGVVEIRARAAATPGIYRTAWGLRMGSTPFGDGAEVHVQVVPRASDSIASSTLIDVILGKVAIQSLVPGSLDLNGDGRIDVADLVKLVNGLAGGE